MDKVFYRVIKEKGREHGNLYNKERLARDIADPSDNWDVFEDFFWDAFWNQDENDADYCLYSQIEDEVVYDKAIAWNWFEEGVVESVTDWFEENKPWILKKLNSGDNET